MVKERDGSQWETALSRLRTIRIEKKGISISTDLMLACSIRGIRIYLVDWRGVGVVAISGVYQHAVAALREAQFKFIESLRSRTVAGEIIRSKLANQRAVLLYFGKGMVKTDADRAQQLRDAAEELKKSIMTISSGAWIESDEWRNKLMGIEGYAATVYWDALKNVGLLSSSFSSREGRGSYEICNAALNYGYAILQSYIWSALENAGFELYAGILHVPRPGKPSLVLDLMEEFRAWVVDRNIIKLRSRLEANVDKGLDQTLKAAIISMIDETMAAKIAWHKKSVKLENVLQRQAYILSGVMLDASKKYRGIHFKW